MKKGRIRFVAAVVAALLFALAPAGLGRNKGEPAKKKPPSLVYLSGPVGNFPPGRPLVVFVQNSGKPTRSVHIRVGVVMGSGVADSELSPLFGENSDFTVVGGGTEGRTYECGDAESGRFCTYTVVVTTTSNRVVPSITGTLAGGREEDQDFVIPAGGFALVSG